jgi:hypothetical protein
LTIHGYMHATILHTTTYMDCTYIYIHIYVHTNNLDKWCTERIIFITHCLNNEPS